MRKGIFVPMIALALALSGCGGEQEASFRENYLRMEGCTMEAEVSCAREGLLWSGTLRCDCAPGGESRVTVLAPESIAGVCAVLDGEEGSLRFEGESLNIGGVSREKLSPAACLPRLMSALREGWLLEENRESWGGVPCVRLALDQSGREGKILSTLWLREEDGTPLRGEIAVEGETVLTAEFTSFAFCDTIAGEEGSEVPS